ncbi:MAG: hypothetical protein QOH90_1829, partial [Actinomycetota bacterium]|nr:hypothetical protein [Actinomycetota bacterium]
NLSADGKPRFHRIVTGLTASLLLVSGGSIAASAAVDTTPPHITEVSDSPDPFTPNGDGTKDKVVFKWTLDEKAVVTVKIFNTNGHLVRDLMRENLIPGVWTIPWNGKDNFKHALAPGTYNYRIRAVDHADNARMVKGTSTLKH